MRHRVYGRHLGRSKDERNRLFRTLLQALFTHGTIETSQDKGKAVKGLVDKVINLAKSKNTQRLLQSYLNNKDLEERLVKEIIPKLGTRSSGFTSMIRLGTRSGDQTMMVKMSLIGAEELEPIKKEVKEKTTRKSVSEKKERTEQSVRSTTSPSKGSKSTKKRTSKLPKTI